MTLGSVKRAVAQRRRRASCYVQIAQADEALTAVFEPHLGALRRPTEILWASATPGSPWRADIL
ncbi:MAG: hypothetical protein AAF909_07735 [Pseudomonadota bacterium]